MKDVKLEIAGMTCQNCVRHVTAALKDLPGVTVREVNIGSANIAADEASEQAAIEAVREAGYEARVSR